MNQKLRIILFGTLLLSALLLTSSLSSHAFAASTTANVNEGTPSLAQPSPSYNKGYRIGFGAGYRAGIAACAAHHYRMYRHPSHNARFLTPFTLGYDDGYADGYNKALYSCSGYNHRGPGGPGGPYGGPGGHDGSDHH